jgi:hypothetical protein
VVSAKNLSPADFSRAAAYPVAAQIEAAVRRKDWPALAALAETNPFLAVAVASEMESEGFLRWVMDEEESTLPNVMLAVREIEIGWGIRTAARAQYVSREQWKAFRHHLVIAEGLLIEVTAHEPGNIVAWHHRLTTARGLELGKTEAQRRYAQLAKHDPHCYRAQSNLQQILCPKWSGSWEELFAFTRECVEAAPPGSLQGALVPLAHLEQTLDLDSEQARKYLRSQPVMDELIAAAAKSVLHPAFTNPYGWVGAHSAFAQVFSMADDLPKAAVHFRAMGNLGDKGCWGYLRGNEQTQFEHFRAKALAKG